MPACVALLLLLAALTSSVAGSVSCRFTQRYTELRQAIGADLIGDFLEDETSIDEDETSIDSGDQRQRTIKGELVWRSSDNRGVFTNGYETWLNGPDGVAKRLNTERFPWEHDAQAAAPPSSDPTSATASQNVATASTPTAIASVVDRSPAPSPVLPTPSLPSQPIIVADLILRNPPDVGGGLQLGGLSGLAPLDRAGVMFASVTDRGPNTDLKVGGDKAVGFLVPSYSPSIVTLRREQDELRVVERIPLRLAQGTDPITGGPQVSGLPTGSRDEPAYDADGRRNLGIDPNGVDTEGIAVDPRDGTYWICEEYGPSILHVAVDSTILTRLVPEGLELKGASYDVKPVLPSVLLKRKQNRGFEGIAISPNGTTVFAIMQSPLSIPDKRGGETSRNLRLVSVDVSGVPRTAAMYLYQTESYSAVGAHEQDDVKIGDLVAISATRLLVTERDSGPSASHRKVYVVDLTAASDIKDKTFAATPLEQMSDADISKARISAVSKRPLVDLIGLGFGHELVEGLALVDDTTIAVVNDNNFDASEPSEMMLIRLPAPLR